MKKYELTDETIEVYGTALHRIKALKDFGNVKKGELGGYVESEHNLSQEGNCWVCGNAEVCGNADYITIKGLGSVCRNTTIFRTKGKNIAVKCGCFYGTLAEFVDKVKETHGNSKFAKEYLALIDLVKIHFELEDK